ncbi:hypothetical protein BDN72DRAFT_841165 [Pluteus cervinus]|uniref:Uncharacterized protein n=1 Tax=Pluteus cervinus TaxID=181527 RepID=A0ACD3ATP9_9AGAR|nr:hypothetical protein BDN72DRAFT_841165 [Pluteus cervinus]
MGDLLDLLDTEVPPSVKERLQELIVGAREGSIKELSILARVHGTLPDPLTSEIHSIFLHHLNSSEVPIKTESNVADIDERRAFWSLWALAELAEAFFRSQQSPDLCGKALVDAWPGIFKWSAYLYASRVQGCGKDQGTTATSRERRVVRDVLIGSWSALSLNESAQKAMVKTRGVADIAARLWLFESDPNLTGILPFCHGIPTVSYLLKIVAGQEDGDQATLDGLVSAAGGDVGLVAQTACGRLKKAFRSPQFVADPRDDLYIFMFFIGLCLHRPKFHEALLDNGIISVCIKFLIWIASVINKELRSPDDRDLFMFVLKYSFVFLRCSLETAAGLPRLLEAINSGLLTAFVECSPLYDDLTDEEYARNSDPVTVMIPRYLAYLSVVEAMDTSLRKLERTPQFLSLRKTRAWEAFNTLAMLTSWRMGVAGEFKQMKKDLSTCHNPKCQKSDVKAKFRKCAKCGWSLYCSKECQTVHWKEYDHKKECRERGKVYNDGKLNPRDWEYIQVLNVCETRYNLPYLKRLASTEHPGVPLENLTIVIDYTALPAAYYVTLRSDWVKKDSKSTTLPKSNDGEAASSTPIVGIVPCGEKIDPTICVMPFGMDLWHLDQNLTMMDGTEARLDPTGNKIIDWMSEDAEARVKLYRDI